MTMTPGMPDPTQPTPDASAVPAPPAPADASATPAAPQTPLEELAGPPAPVDTSNNRRDGLDKCPKCGSSEIGPIVGTDRLRCGFCRFEWAPSGSFMEAIGFDSPIEELRGTVLTTGVADIDSGADLLITMKCQGCGAEVVINTERQLQARCHWCRQTLSQNTQIPNGAVPDAILPFTVTHAQAVEQIKKFAGSRRAFAHKKFKAAFTPENIVGVYMPYMVVDGNLHADLAGHGEIKTREYQRGSDNNKRTYYDADVYRVTRSFDFTVDDLTVESSSSRSDHDTRRNTNNVINTILPFDTHNAVAYNASYMGEFTSEKRDLNVADMEPRVRDQMMSIARQKATDSAPHYDRGIRWEGERLDVHGTRWVSVLLPVWLYSYYEKKSNGQEFLHYIAVNGRTGETMGSIPVSVPKLLLVSMTIGTVLEGLALWIVFTF